jgi:hypothetical protein
MGSATDLRNWRNVSSKALMSSYRANFTTREYDRTIKVPNGKKVIEHVMKQLVVELKADTIRILDQSSNGERDAAEPQTFDTQEEAN